MDDMEAALEILKKFGLVVVGNSPEVVENSPEVPHPIVPDSEFEEFESEEVIPSCSSIDIERDLSDDDICMLYIYIYNIICF